MLMHQSSCENAKNAHLDDFQLTGGLFSAVIAIVLGGFYYVLRVGLAENDISCVLQTLSLSLFILLFPCMGQFLFARFRDDSRRSWIFSEAALSLFGLSLAVLAGVVTPYVPFSFAPFFCVCGLFFFVVVFVRWWRGGSIGRNLIFLGIAACFGLCAGVSVFGSNYHDPLFTEAIVAGRAHLDELLVSATSSMIRTYGIPSTGLDGVPYCHYHWGSWWIFAQLSRLLHVPAVTFIHLGFPVVFAPLLLNGLLGFSRAVRARLPHPGAARPLRTDYLFWVTCAAAIFGFLPPIVSSFMALGISVSESYTVSLYLFLQVLALGMNLQGYAIPGGKPLGLAECAFLFPILPFLIGVACATKISTGFLLVVICGYVFLRYALYRRVYFVVSFVAVLAVTIFTIHNVLEVTNVASRGTLVYPFHFLLNHVPPWFWPFLFPAHYFWAIVCVGTLLVAGHLRSLSAISHAVRSKETIAPEVLIVVCAAGAAPGLIIAIGAGSAYYFSHVQAWLAVGLLLGGLQALRGTLEASELDKPRSEGRVYCKTGLRGYVPRAIPYLVVAGVLFFTAHGFAYAIYRNVSIRLCLCRGEHIRSNEQLGCGGKEWFAAFLSHLREAITGRGGLSVREIWEQYPGRLRTTLQTGLERNDRYLLIKLLRDMQKLPEAEKRQTLVFIPQSNEAYWGLIDAHVIGAFGYPACKSVPFIAPALTEMAMIDGLPSPECDLYAFGYYAYRKRTHPQTEFDTRDETLCTKARAKGFSRVIVIEAGKGDIMKMRRISCDDP